MRAIKIAPFNRYQTLDVLEAVAQSGRRDDIALYTGNDDNILIDLVTRFTFRTRAGRRAAPHRRRAAGPVGLLDETGGRAPGGRSRRSAGRGGPVPMDMLTLAAQMTLANKAIFDADNAFAGCIPGISYVLKRQGLMNHIGTLDPADRLSPGQTEQIDQIIRLYPHLTDDEFVRANRDAWLAP